MSLCHPPFRRHLSPAFFVALLCCAALALPSPSHAADAAIIRLWPGWRDSDSFDRIGEFLGGTETASGRTLLRSQPAERAGYYFLLRVHSARPLAAGAKFELQVIRPDSPEPKTFTFPVTAPSGDSVFDLGLTGADWPSKKANPVAWKLALLAADGRVLVEDKSFLWEKPAK